MQTKSLPNVSADLRSLPSVDELARSETGVAAAKDFGPVRARTLMRKVVADLRTEIIGGSYADVSKEILFSAAQSRLAEATHGLSRRRLCRVINGTGVIIHTNLGRAPLSKAARRAIADEAGEYYTLEYDVETGRRGRRGAYAEHLIAELTGADDAVVVNNCAAAAYFVLTAFAAGGEVIVSRGELVEIGGDFRVPDVLAASGAVLREVGTTNRTKTTDYERAINENTRMILRVHPSNYRIVGFTSRPELEDLVAVARRKNLILFEDVGSGAMIDLNKYGLGDEPIPAHSIAKGADVVSFSGDKLFGGPQAGIIIGNGSLIGKLRTHPLFRVLRADKMTYSALAATLESYSREAATEEIPVLRMIAASKAEIGARVERFLEKLKNRTNTSNLQFSVCSGQSAIGGGSAPGITLETVLLTLAHRELSADTLESKLRSGDPTVIARIENDKVVIDLRTVSERDEAALLEVLSGI